MGKNNQILKINKIPLDYNIPDITPNFSNLNPTLYLELLENTDKVKPESKNKDYVPSAPSELEIEFIDDNEKKYNPKENYKESVNRFKIKKPDKGEVFTKNSYEVRRNINNESKNNTYSFIDKDEMQKIKQLKQLKNRKGDSKRTKFDDNRNDKNKIDNKEENYHRHYNQDKRPDGNEYADRKKDEHKDKLDENNENYSTERNNEEQDDRVRHDIDNLLLGKEHNDPEKHVQNSSSSGPPKLSEIPANNIVNVGGKLIKDISRPNKAQDADDSERRELLFKFDILRKKYRGSNIPDFGQFSDLQVMKRTYDVTVRKLSLDSTVETYKKYLLGGFMLVEFGLGFFKFDISGFAQQQMLSINSYEQLLVEIGEKNYIQGGNQFPVEVRLCLLVLINVSMFLVSKKVGTNIFGMLRNSNSSPANPLNTTEKRKMKGPNLDVDELKKSS